MNYSADNNATKTKEHKKTKKTTKGYEYNIIQQQLPTNITKHCTCRGAGGVSPKTGRFAVSPFRSRRKSTKLKWSMPRRCSWFDNKVCKKMEHQTM